jgi:hypothetical protein
MYLKTAVPILAYLEADPTVDFYQRLGFACNARWPGYLIFSRDAIEIHLWQCEDPGIPKHTGCYVRVDNVEDLYAECLRLDCIHPEGSLTEKLWGMRQFSILDNSGNIIHFGEPLPGND